MNGVQKELKTERRTVKTTILGDVLLSEHFDATALRYPPFFCSDKLDLSFPEIAGGVELSLGLAFFRVWGKTFITGQAQ